jgi:CBS domain-containing protein
METTMQVQDVLRSKGNGVITVSPDITVAALLAVLAEHRIGAAVVSRSGSTVDGIASERDIVRAFAARGAAALADPVSAICTVDVRTVEPDVRTEELMRLMTELRIRHVPVVQHGELLGIVSIGDVVKSRITELETERTALADYIATAR